MTDLHKLGHLLPLAGDRIVIVAVAVIVAVKRQTAWPLFLSLSFLSFSYLACCTTQL